MSDLFYVVKFTETGNKEIVPDFWYSNKTGLCYWPPTNPELTAEYRGNVKLCWPRRPSQILTVHSRFLILLICYLRHFFTI